MTEGRPPRRHASRLSPRRIRDDELDRPGVGVSEANVQLLGLLMRKEKKASTVCAAPHRSAESTARIGHTDVSGGQQATNEVPGVTRLVLLSRVEDDHHLGLRGGGVDPVAYAEMLRESAPDAAGIAAEVTAQRALLKRGSARVGLLRQLSNTRGEAIPHCAFGSLPH